MGSESFRKYVLVGVLVAGTGKTQGYGDGGGLRKSKSQVVTQTGRLTESI